MADADIKLFRPQRLTDNPDGGGLATKTEIVDGEINNLWDDISRIDRVNGEVSLRKFFVLADTPDTELYSDVHVIVQSEPLDPRVSVVLFRTSSWSDVRADAQAYVERYLDESVITRMVVYDRQLTGQRTVLVYQRPELSLPEIGQVYALKNESTGQREFIRVQDVQHQVEAFSDERGDFNARVITLTISQPLSQEFSGSQPNRYFTAESARSVMRKTIASDAARYKGIVRLAEDAAAGELNIKVESVFVQLVPAVTSEVAVVDATPAGALVPVASGDRIPQDYLHSSGGYTPTQIMPGSVRLGSTQVDDGTGRIVDENTGQVVPGMTVDYEAGRFLSTDLDTFASYVPAVFISKTAHSLLQPVTIGTRGYVYAPVLRPLPQRGSTQVAFRALGQWYVLNDNGSGELVGEPGTGSGLVNYVTGSTPVTLGALPDIGSAVIFSYGSKGEYEIRTDDVAIDPPRFSIQTDAENIEPGTLTVGWFAGAVAKSATDDGEGNLTGDATGRVIYASGRILLLPTVLPDSNTSFELEFEAGSSETEVFAPAVVSGSIIVTTAQPIRAGSLHLSTVGYGQSKPHREITDDGAGGLIDANGKPILGGGVVYESGIITLPAGVSVLGRDIDREAYAPALPGRQAGSGGTYGAGIAGMMLPSFLRNTPRTVDWINGTAVTVRYKRNDEPDLARSEEHAPGPLELRLTPGVSNVIVPGGVLFEFGGRRYVDREGSLYYGASGRFLLETLGGSIDYVDGVALLTSWQGGQAPTLTLLSLLTEIGALPMAVVHGRTPGSPLRPGTFTLRAVRYRDGAALIATADNNGNIDTPQMHGWVDVNTGVFSVGFGAYVLDSSLSESDKAEPWYNSAMIDEDGWIWRPDEVLPSSIRFNCVVQVSVPIDPEIIKVNPVRLPMDGRVPVLRKGDTLVIQDAQPYTLPAGLEAGQVVSLPRGSLASVALYDQAGLGITRDLYEVDLDAGEMLMADPLDLAGYVEPFVAIHVVEDMALCLDAEITGEVKLGQALTHDYSAENATVASAQILGDAQARYGYLFTQATWTNVWSDELIGSAPPSGARYNDALYPLVLANTNTITERWRLTFTSSTAYVVVGEKLGQIAAGTTAADCEPINPATGEPYFTLLAAGFGSGYGTGNTIRFNTYGAGGPMWAARTVLSGPATATDDRVRLQVRWDKD